MAGKPVDNAMSKSEAEAGSPSKLPNGTDIHRQPADKPVDNARAKSEAEAGSLWKLQNEINLHRQSDESKSLLQRGAGWVYDRLNSDASTTGSLTALYQDTQSKLKSGSAQEAAAARQEIARAIESDHSVVESRDSAIQYMSGFAKTAALFARGKVGLAATVGIYACDQVNPYLGPNINPRDAWRTHLIDAGVGGLKGATMKGLFQVMGGQPVFAPLKGAALGFGNTFLDVSLSPNSYRDSKGDYHVASALKNGLLSASDLNARKIDAGGCPVFS